MLTFSRTTLFTLLCGMLAGSVFAFSSYNADAGLMVLFMPAMPLAIIGLAVSARHCLAAGAVACVMVGLLSGPDYVVFFAILIVFPLQHFVRKALLWRGDEEEREWHPVLPILADLTLIAAAVFMIFSILTAHSENGDLKTIIAHALDSQINNQIRDAEPKLAYFMRMIADEWNFLLFAFVSWIWVVCIYAFAVIANLFLSMNNIALRPSLALKPVGLSLWMPGLILVSVLLTLFGSGNDRYVGETSLLILLLPYFLCGLASLHAVTQDWGSRRFWLGAFYLILALFPWIAVFVIAKGLHTQLESFWKTHMTSNDH